MKRQFKWYKIDKEELTSTYDNIKLQLNDKILMIKENEILIEYEYDGKYGYKYILEKMSNFRANQKIITTSKFYNLLTKSLKKEEIKIAQIKFLECLDDQNIAVYKYINAINETKNKKFLEELLDELNWLNIEGVDIQYVEFSIKKETLIFDFQLFSNGIVLIDDDSVLNEVIEFIATV